MALKSQRFTGVSIFAACDGIAAIFTFDISSRLLSGRFAETTLVASPLANFYLLFFLVPISFALMGVYAPTGRNAVDLLQLRVKAALLFSLGILAGQLFSGQIAYFFVLLFALAVFIVFSSIFNAILLRCLLRHAAWGRDAVIIGEAQAARSMALMLKSNPDVGLRPIGIIAEPCNPDASSARGLDVPFIKDLKEFPLSVRSRVIGIALSGSGDNSMTARAAQQLLFRDFIVVPDLAEMEALGLQPGSFNGLFAYFARRERPWWHQIIKYIVDRAVGTMLLIAVSPAVGFTALLVRATSPGPAFYRQIRIGRDGQQFVLWKLRTMHTDAEDRLQSLLASNPAAAEEWTRCFKLTNDPRIIPWVGHLLRCSSIDELPQLWNVVRGDMSLVGPRPFPPYHLEQFDSEFRDLRCGVTPGLTGLWQISIRSDGDLYDQQQLDTYYIRNWSLWLDFHILMLTIYKVFIGSGAR